MLLSCKSKGDGGFLVPDKPLYLGASISTDAGRAFPFGGRLDPRQGPFESEVSDFVQIMCAGPAQDLGPTWLVGAGGGGGGARAGSPGGAASGGALTEEELSAAAAVSAAATDEGGAGSFEAGRRKAAGGGGGLFQPPRGLPALPKLKPPPGQLPLPRFEFGELPKLPPPKLPPLPGLGGPRPRGALPPLPRLKPPQLPGLPQLSLREAGPAAGGAPANAAPPAGAQRKGRLVVVPAGGQYGVVEMSPEDRDPGVWEIVDGRLHKVMSGGATSDEFPSAE